MRQKVCVVAQYIKSVRTGWHPQLPMVLCAECDAMPLAETGRFGRHPPQHQIPIPSVPAPACPAVFGLEVQAAENAAQTAVVVLHKR